MTGGLDDLRSRGETPAVIDEGIVYPYSSLRSLTTLFAERLEALGVADVVALSADNSIELVAAFLAARSLTAAVVLLPAKLPSATLALIGEAIAPSAYVLSDAQWERCSAFLGGRAAFASVVRGPSATLHVIKASGLPAHAPQRHSGAVVYKVTSGSSGHAKIVAITEPALQSEARQVCDTLSLTASDRVMSGVSMLHSYGIRILVSSHRSMSERRL